MQPALPSSPSVSHLRLLSVQPTSPDNISKSETSPKSGVITAVAAARCRAAPPTLSSTTNHHPLLLSSSRRRGRRGRRRFPGNSLIHFLTPPSPSDDRRKATAVADFCSLSQSAATAVAGFCSLFSAPYPNQHSSDNLCRCRDDDNDIPSPPQQKGTQSPNSQIRNKHTYSCKFNSRVNLILLCHHIYKMRFFFIYMLWVIAMKGFHENKK